MPRTEACAAVAANPFGTETTPLDAGAIEGKCVAGPLSSVGDVTGKKDG